MYPMIRCAEEERRMKRGGAGEGEGGAYTWMWLPNGDENDNLPISPVSSQIVSYH